MDLSLAWLRGSSDSAVKKHNSDSQENFGKTHQVQGKLGCTICGLRSKGRVVSLHLVPLLLAPIFSSHHAGDRHPNPGHKEDSTISASAT